MLERLFIYKSMERQGMGKWLPIGRGQGWVGCWEGILPCGGGDTLARVPRGAVAAPGSLGVSRASLDGTQSGLGWWRVSLPMARGGTGWVLMSLPNPAVPRFPDSMTTQAAAAHSPCTQTPAQCLTQGPTAQMNSGQRGEHQ